VVFHSSTVLGWVDCGEAGILRRYSLEHYEWLSMPIDMREGIEKGDNNWSENNDHT